MNLNAEEKDEISGNNFAVDITELSIAFMDNLKLVHEGALKNDKKYLVEWDKYVNTFNTEILKLVAKLPPRILGALFHDSVIKKTLDPGCLIKICGDKIDIYLSEKGTIQ